MMIAGVDYAHGEQKYGDHYCSKHDSDRHHTNRVAE
jgi:hypothetical protein